jgi:hypothetical protein
MIDWNYRVIIEETGTYRVIEVYYDEHGNVDGWTFPDPIGDTVDETLEVCVEFQRALTRVIQGVEPLLTIDDLPSEEEVTEHLPMDFEYCIDLGYNTNN